MNRVLLFGRLGTDPELKEVGSGTSLCKFRMATTERVKKGDKFEEETEWHSITIWGKRGAGLAKHLNKGDRVLVEGRMHTSSYEDREGVKRYATEVIASNVEFGSDRKKTSSGGAEDDRYDYGDEDDPSAPPRTSSASRGGR